MVRVVGLCLYLRKLYRSVGLGHIVIYDSFGIHCNGGEKGGSDENRDASRH